METGVTVYRNDANYYPVFWMYGEPVKRTFLGFQGDNLDVSGKELKQISTTRCAACGFLEFTAA